MKRKIEGDYLRTSIFGFEDALVSTTGVIIGVAAGAHDKKVVILAGLVTITVEAISMAVGQFLSEEAVHEEYKNKKYTTSLSTEAAIMFVSYAIGGIVPLAPILFLPLSISLIPTALAAGTGLFVLGFVKAMIVGVSPFKSAFKVLVLGGVATAVGVTVGLLLKL